MYVEFTPQEQIAASNVFSALRRSGILASESSEKGFILLLKKQLFSPINIKTELTEKDRNSFMLLALLRAFFSSNKEVLLNCSLDDVVPPKFSDVLQGLFENIAQLIEAIITLYFNNMKLPTGILARSILELCWLVDIFTYNPPKILDFIDTTVDEYTRWRSNFSPSLLQKSIDEINEDVLQTVPDYIDYLKITNQRIYKKYSQYTHISWEAIQTYSNALLDDIIYSLWYSAILLHFVSVKRNEWKTSVTLAGIINVSSHSMLMELGPQYLDSYKWD